jgi:hypothetical protein
VNLVANPPGPKPQHKLWNNERFQNKSRTGERKPMKHTKLMAIAILLLLAISGATAQSLGDYARTARKNKTDSTPTTRHFDNDNLPVNDSLSVVGPQPMVASAVTTAKAADAKPDPAAAGAEQKKAADEWKKKIEQQQEKITFLNHEIALSQREAKLRAAQYYGDPYSRVHNSVQADQQDAQAKSELEAKQKELDSARQQLDQMQEDARKAGIAQAQKAKDTETNSNTDAAKDNGK